MSASILLREHPVFSALVSPAEKNRLRSRAKKKISVTSAVSDQSQFTLHIPRSNALVFAWISRKRGGKYGRRCVVERMGSFRVWKTQQASRGSLATCCRIKERCFCESSNWFRKVCSISGFVYCVLLCGTNKLEPKKPDALAGYSLCTAALFLASEP